MKQVPTSKTKLRILAIHSAYQEDQTKRQATDQWRISRPLEELAKHTDWQIDHRTSLIPEIEKYKDKAEFTDKELEATFNDISSYDVVFSSYQPNPTMYSLLKVAEAKHGTQFVMDVDDNMFAINPDNPVWMKLNDEQVYFMQCMIRDNTWLTTTTESLATVFRDRRPEKPKDSVFVIPNYISDVYHAEPFDNGDKVVVGFFGGSSHFADLHESGLLPALQRVMHEHKNVYFKSIGMPIDYYLPKARVQVIDPKRGDGWYNDLFPNMQLDIAVAPLLDNPFNAAKSDIKWQEATRAGSAVIASSIGPYVGLRGTNTALLTFNTESGWYDALTSLVTNKEKRHKLVQTAQKNLAQSHRLETNWMKYHKLFETVVGSRG